MGDSPRCHGHEVRPQSQISPPSVTNEWRLCIHCFQYADEHGLEPGEDFALGELPIPGGDS